MQLSILIPTLGRQTLQPVLFALTRCDGWATVQPEVVVVLDAPQVTDRQVWEQTQARYAHVLQMRFLESTGADRSAARNIAIDAARGEVLCFLGDDTLPTPAWLQHLTGFFMSHPEPTTALLGTALWTPVLLADPFHRWLLGSVQFQLPAYQSAFTRVWRGIQGYYYPTWRDFHTACVAVPRALLGEERFSERFTGWGFEDTELGYRLWQRGMQLHYLPEWTVYHDHLQTPEAVWQRTRESRHNAAIFESLYPELPILPRGVKRTVLTFILQLLRPLVWGCERLGLAPRLRWWYCWKRAWLGR
ncbi:glycosyltransferase family 2 protein [Candidatus Peribacteria bacterium]|nr:glycosyltransferase family 2 protein [Candidatus Peribacteria bacterium]